MRATGIILLLSVPTAALRVPRTLQRRALFDACGLAAAAAVAAPVSAFGEDGGPLSVRPLAYEIKTGEPPFMQPYLGRAVGTQLKQLARNDVVLLGARRGSARDMALAVDLVEKLRGASGRPVVLALDAAPLDATPALEAFRASDKAAGALDSCLDGAAAWPAVASTGGDASYLRPALELLSRGVVADVVALGVDAESTVRVQRAGIAALSEAERAAYVDDVAKFVRYEKSSGFDTYAKRVIERRYEEKVLPALAAGGDAAAGPSAAAFFASTILYDEACATLCARCVRAHRGALTVAIVDDQHVKFGYGALGRLQRLQLDPDLDEADPKAAPITVQSVLLNPSPDSTGSTTKRLRLELWASPELGERKPLADFVWFDTSPSPALLKHMMNPIDGTIKIDMGLSGFGSN